MAPSSLLPRRILIAGDSLAGWMSAAYLARIWREQDIEIHVYPVSAAAQDPPAIAAAPSLRSYHETLGLDERDVIRFCKGAFRLGARYELGGTAFVHGYGPYGVALDRVAFRHHWFRLKAHGLADSADFHDFCLSAAAGEQDRFGIATQGTEDQPGLLEYGFHLDTSRYVAFMRKCALHYGAEFIPDPVVGSDLTVDGSVSAIRNASGATTNADLYIDCSDDGAALRAGLLDAEWRPATRGAPDPVTVYWSRRTGETALGVSNTECKTHRWTIQIPTQRDVAQATFIATDDNESAAPAAPDKDAQLFSMQRFTPGWRRPWHGNCIAIGNAAARFEPIEGPELVIIQKGLDTLRKLFPIQGNDCGEAREYNRTMLASFSRFRQFQQLIMAQDVRRFSIPASDDITAVELARRIEQFAERARVVMFDEDSFDQESWIAVNVGRGVSPRQIDALALAAPIDMISSKIRKLKSAIRKTVSSMPLQRDFLASTGLASPEN